MKQNEANEADTVNDIDTVNETDYVNDTVNDTVNVNENEKENENVNVLFQPSLPSFLSIIFEIYIVIKQDN